jgi:hypothetical protein
VLYQLSYLAGLWIEKNVWETEYIIRQPGWPWSRPGRIAAMSARADQFAHLVLPSPRRWLAATALAMAAVKAVTIMRYRARQPHLPPMSIEWLQSHAADRTYQSND